MPKIVNYKPDGGVKSLIAFYEEMDVINGVITEGSLLFEVVNPLELIYKKRGKVRRQIGTWASLVDPFLNTKREVNDRCKTIQGSIVKNATYSEILKKIIFKIRTNDLSPGLRTGWLTKFTDPNSLFYCSAFVKDVMEINPILGNSVSVDHDKRKKWLITLVRSYEKLPYLNKVVDKKHKDIANRKYPLGIVKTSPLEMFRTYCLPESKLFDPTCFEQVFAALEWKVDGANPDQSIKDLIVRVLSSGYYIDCPSWHDFQEKSRGRKLSNESLWFWFERYTNTSSQFYDLSFDTKLRENFLQQYHKNSLTFEGLRCYDRKKNEIIAAVELDPNIDLTLYSAHMGDKIFKNKLYAAAKRNTPEIYKQEVEDRFQQRKKSIIDLLQNNKLFEDFSATIDGKVENLFPFFVRCIKEDDYYFDEEFTKQVNEIDPLIVKHIRKEYNNKNSFKLRLKREYKKEKFKLFDPQWFVVKPSYKTLFYLDFENSKRDPHYRNSVDPSFFAEVRKTGDFSRDNIRNLYFKKYNSIATFDGNAFRSFQSDRSLPYTFNLSNNFNFEFKKSMTDFDILAQLFVQAGKKNIPYVPKKGEYAGYIIFKAAIEPTEAKIVEYLHSFIIKDQQKEMSNEHV